MAYLLHAFDCTIRLQVSTRGGKEHTMAKFTRIVIQLPLDLKLKLDKLKLQGYTTSGFIRAVLERELSKPEHAQNDQEMDGNGRP